MQSTQRTKQFFTPRIRVMFLKRGISRAGLRSKFLEGSGNLRSGTPRDIQTCLAPTFSETKGTAVIALNKYRYVLSKNTC